jgi:hypothetical protein
MPKDLLGREYRIGQTVLYLHVVDLKIEHLAGKIVEITKEFIFITLDGHACLWQVSIESNRIKAGVRLLILKDVLSDEASNIINKNNRFDLLDL